MHNSSIKKVPHYTSLLVLLQRAISYEEPLPPELKDEIKAVIDSTEPQLLYDLTPPLKRATMNMDLNSFD